MPKTKYLLTGSNGFLGRNILSKLGSDDVTTLDISEADINCDLANNIPVIPANIDVVIHAAGKAHFLPRSRNEEQLFYNVNLNGTINLCAGLKKEYLPKAIIYISTVAVYGEDFGENINENHPLNGNSAYALSKILAERYLQDFCSSHKIVLGIIRPPLIAGNNPPGNLGQLVLGIRSGRYFRIGKANARKSIVMADDIAKIIPSLSNKGGIYNLSDDVHPSVKELENTIMKQVGKEKILKIPFFFAKTLAIIGDISGNWFPLNSMKLNKLTRPLTFSNEKAKKELNWQPVDVLSNFKIN